TTRCIPSSLTFADAAVAMIFSFVEVIFAALRNRAEERNAKLHNLAKAAYECLFHRLLFYTIYNRKNSISIIAPCSNSLVVEILK
ncbi:MAG: hypothetical protein ACREUA_02010, partial [Burkholderiales bacterium]